VLLIHPGGPYWTKKDLGAWSIPKGGREDGEGLRECALRELEEELGAAPAVETDALVPLGWVRQKGGKIVYAWAIEADFDPRELNSIAFEMEWPPRSGQMREFPEADEAEWLDPDTARQKINLAQAVFIDRLIDHLAQPG
jgi:predicted NUDIX family NTP pyrophosphohydrolase